MNFKKYCTIVIAVTINYVAQALDLKTAIETQKVNATITSTGEHSGKCLKVVFHANIQVKQTIEISAGTYLINEQESAQNHLITENIIVQLTPNESKTIMLNGFCCERNDGAPKQDSKFTIATYDRQDVIGLCKIISKYPEQKYDCQQSIWSLVQKQDPNNEVEGEDSAKVMELRKYICSALKLPLKPYITSNYNRPVIVTSTMDVHAYGSWILKNMKRGDVVSTALFDTAGKAITVTKKETCTEPYGTITKDRYKVFYNVAATDLEPSSKLYLRIMVNNVVQKEYCYKANWN